MPITPTEWSLCGRLLASELIVHLQQFPSPPPLYCLSEKLTLKAISKCSSLKVSALSWPKDRGNASCTGRTCSNIWLWSLLRISIAFSHWPLDFIFSLWIAASLPIRLRSPSLLLSTNLFSSWVKCRKWALEAFCCIHLVQKLEKFSSVTSLFLFLWPNTSC